MNVSATSIYQDKNYDQCHNQENGDLGARATEKRCDAVPTTILIISAPPALFVSSVHHHLFKNQLDFDAKRLREPSQGFHTRN